MASVALYKPSKIQFPVEFGGFYPCETGALSLKKVQPNKQTNTHEECQ